MDRPTKDMCREWRMHPVTQYFVSELRRNVSNIGSSFTGGEFISDTEFETTKLNIKAVGMSKALNESIDFIDDMGAPDDKS